MKIKVFDDLLSLLHFFLGFLCSFLYLMSSPFINLAVLITLIYFSYEFIEALLDLDFGSLIGDLIEFFLGIIFGLIIIFFGPALLGPGHFLYLQDLI
jgi:hypothetical protein